MQTILKNMARGAFIVPICLFGIGSIVLTFIGLLYFGLNGLFYGLAMFYYLPVIILVFIPLGIIVGFFVGILELFHHPLINFQGEIGAQKIKKMLLLILGFEILLGLLLLLSWVLQR